MVCSFNPKTNTIKELYTTQDVMEMFGISRGTLNTYRKKGYIGFIQDLKSVRFTQQHIDEYKKRGKNGGKGID